MHCNAGPYKDFQFTMVPESRRTDLYKQTRDLLGTKDNSKWYADWAQNHKEEKEKAEKLKKEKEAQKEEKRKAEEEKKKEGRQAVDAATGDAATGVAATGDAATGAKDQNSLLLPLPLTSLLFYPPPLGMRTTT